MRKLIGLTGPSSFTQECVDMIENIIDANFVLLYHNNTDHLNKWIGEVDGVILAGGLDVHPSVYGESVWHGYNLSKFDIRRDIRELFIIDKCLERRIPMFGICKGHQLLGLKHGLPFVMDISSSDISHNPTKQNINVSTKEPAHAVRIQDMEYFVNNYEYPYEADERKVITRSLGKKGSDEKIFVNSFHHQAVGNPGVNEAKEKNDVRILGVAKTPGMGDNVKEIIEFMEGPYKDPHWFSVQWHPEFDWMDNTPSKVVINKFKKLIEKR